MGDMSVYNYDQLNDFICYWIQSNGMEYVAENYITLREDYYNNQSSATL
jgi:hypothetical protein